MAVFIDLFLFYQSYSYLDLVMQRRRPSLMASALMAAYLRLAVVMLCDIVIYLRMVNKFFFFNHMIYRPITEFSRCLLDFLICHS